MLFEELNISPDIVKGLKEMGLVEATGIQERTIPLIKEGRDVIGISKTGSGKTAAFGIPIIEKIEPKKGVQALIIAPVRELSVQITKELHKFGKYARISQHKYLQKVFDTAPRMIGQRIKYSNIAPDTRSRDLKNALNLLSFAGIVRPIYLTKASGLPLGAQINEQKFKLNFLDVGLMQNSCGLQGRLSIEEDFMQINAGAVAEQFVGQELTAYSDRHQQVSLYFWAREKRGSMAEVDYVINIGSDIFPIEVKSGKEGRLKSLRMFIEEKKSSLGIRFSQDQLSYFDKILTIPLYMIEQLPRLVGNSGCC